MVALLELTPGIVRMTFAEKLKALRKDAGLSERELANRSGVAFGTIRNYGMTAAKPSLEVAAKLARVLGVSTDVLAECDDVAGPTVADAVRPPELDEVSQTWSMLPQHVRESIMFMVRCAKKGE